MSNIVKVLSLVLMVGALAGGVFLVNGNVQFLGKASQAETSSSILPNILNTSAGQNSDVHVWFNTGNDTDKLSGAEFTVTFDPSKLSLVSATEQNGYTILNTDQTGPAGSLIYKMVTLGAEKSGAVELLKLTFKSLGFQSGTIVVSPGAKIMINGQPATWDVAINNACNYSAAGGGGTPVITCTPRPPCLDETPACMIAELPSYCPKPTETAAPTLTITPTLPPTSTPTPPTATSTPTLGSISCAQGSELKTFADDFSGATFDTNKWWMWTNNAGTVGQNDGKVILNLPSTTAPNGSGISIGPKEMGTSGDFNSEITLVDHTNLNDRIQSTLNLTFADDNWTRVVHIFKNYNDLSGLNVIWYDVGTTSWKTESTNTTIGHNTPVKVKIERTGSTFRVSYDMLDGNGYKLEKQLDNYYSGQGQVSISLSNFAPNFPQTSASIDNFNMTACVPSNPTNLKAICSSDGTQVTLTWDAVANAAKYALRLDDMSNNSNICKDGWMCPNTSDAEADVVSTTNSYNILPNKQYNWWIHTINNEALSSGIGGGTFTCAGNEVTGTVAPTPTTDPSGVLKFKTTFAGVQAGSVCADNWKGTVTVLWGNSQTKTFNNVLLTNMGNSDGLMQFSGQIPMAGIGSSDGLAVFIKGPRQLQTKFGIDGQTGYYNKAGGEIGWQNGKVYDFSQYANLAGDVTGPDGVPDGRVDGLDFAYVKAEVAKRTSGDNLMADLNGNCQLESQDLSLLMVAMSNKMEQLY